MSVPRDQAEALLQIELVPITVIITWQFEIMMKRILLIRLHAGKLNYPFYKTCFALASRQLDGVSFYTLLSHLRYLRSPVIITTELNSGLTLLHRFEPALHAMREVSLDVIHFYYFD